MPPDEKWTRRTYHARETTVASQVVRTANTVGIREIRELNENLSDKSNCIHDRGGLCRADSPKVMGEREDGPPVANVAELWVHRVVQNAGLCEKWPEDFGIANHVCRSVDLKYYKKEPDKNTCMRPTCFVAYMTEPSLILPFTSVRRPEFWSQKLWMIVPPGGVSHLKGRSLSASHSPETSV